jgi:hypothetical protein
MYITQIMGFHDDDDADDDDFDISFFWYFLIIDLRGHVQETMRVPFRYRAFRWIVLLSIPGKHGNGLYTSKACTSILLKTRRTYIPKLQLFRGACAGQSLM